MSPFRCIAPFSPNKRILFADKDTAAPTPLIAGEFLPQFHQDRHAAAYGRFPSIGVYRFNNLTVGPYGLIIDHDGKILYADDLLQSWVAHEIQQRLQADNPKDVIVAAVKGTAQVLDMPCDVPIISLGRPGYEVYGHWILDILPSLWLFVTTESEHGLDPSEAIYLLPSNPPSWAMEMVDCLFGISQNQIATYDQSRQVVRGNRVFVVSMLRRDAYFAQEMNAFAASIVSHIAAPPSPDLPKRFYVTREAISSSSSIRRNIIDAIELERIASLRGFQVLDPASLSWREQVRLFADADIVLGPFGSGMHNTLFSPATTLSVVLGSSRMNWIQSGIAALRRQRMAYLFPEREVEVGENFLLEYSAEQFIKTLDIVTNN